MAIYSGSVMQADAIGDLVLARLAALRQAGIEAHCFTTGTDVLSDDITPLATPADLHRLAFFREASIHLFEFGWCYDLFDAVRDVEKRLPVVVGFHGLTPKRLLPDDKQSEYARAERQLALARRADSVIAASSFSAERAAEAGVEPSRIRILPLPTRLERLPSDRTGNARARLMFVGRMAPVKGFIDLLRVLASLAASGHADWSLSVVTNPLTAEPAYLRQVRQFIEQGGLTAHVEFFGKLEDKLALSRLYARSDIAIVPSQYETYGLPVLEALASGCAVIAHDVGAIAETGGGLVRLVRAGAADRLAEAILEGLATRRAGLVPVSGGMLLPRAEFERQAESFLKDRTARAHDDAFVQLLRDGASGVIAKRGGGRRFWPWNF